MRIRRISTGKPLLLCPRLRPPRLMSGSEMKSGKERRKLPFRKDRRRRHRHWQVTVFYRDREKFVRVYTDRAKATNFAERQKKSPVVRETRITQIGT